MTDELRASAHRLYCRLNRDRKGAVITIGMGKSTIGNEVLIAFCAEGPLAVPQEYEGYPVIIRRATLNT